MARLIAAPAFAVVVAEVQPKSWLLWAIWGILATSDSLDGHLARRHGTTRSGAFLDPLADKFLVIATLCALVVRGLVPVIAVVLIAVREIGMSVFRTFAAKRGVSVPAQPVAKAKTLLQDIAVGLFFFPPSAPHLTFDHAVLWAAVALTLLSGLLYMRDGRRLMSGSAR